MNFNDSKKGIAFKVKKRLQKDGRLFSRSQDAGEKQCAVVLVQ